MEEVAQAEVRRRLFFLGPAFVGCVLGSFVWVLNVLPAPASRVVQLCSGCSSLWFEEHIGLGSEVQTVHWSKRLTSSLLLILEMPSSKPNGKKRAKAYSFARANALALLAFERIRG